MSETYYLRYFQSFMIVLVLLYFHQLKKAVSFTANKHSMSEWVNEYSIFLSYDSVLFFAFIISNMHVICTFTKRIFRKQNHVLEFLIAPFSAKTEISNLFFLKQEFMELCENHCVLPKNSTFLSRRLIFNIFNELSQCQCCSYR